MKKPLSSVLDQITPSMTLAVTGKAKQLKAEGKRVYGFGAGEPDFFVNDVIKAAAKEAIDKNYSKYTDVAGLYELREAICGKLERENHLSYSPEEILVTSGAKHSLYTALMALCSPGDEVIIPSPYWVSYSEMAKLAGAKIVIVPTKKENGFILTPSELAAAITPKTKAIMLNNPSNPTGAVYTESELRAVAEICVRSGIYILSDEIYDRFVYDGCRHISTASLSEEIKDITLTINGLSKTYAMPGWRVGYTAASKEIIKAMNTISGHCVSHTSAVSQYAAVTALNTDQGFVGEMLEEYCRRRELVMKLFDEIPAVSYIKPMGAFYLFVDVSQLYGKTHNSRVLDGSLSFCDELLTDKYVAAIPGIGFGADEFIRISYAVSQQDISEGIGKIKEFISEIK